MPMYDYRCKECGHVFEELVFSRKLADSEIVCPQCKTRNSERLLSAPSIGGTGTDSAFSGGCSSSSGFS